MTIIKRFNYFSSILLFIIFSQYAQADKKRYDVEILIFEDANAHYINSEDWIQRQTSFDSASKRAAHFSPIRPYILTDSYKRLKASNNYNVLFFGGWRQTGLSKRSAFTISLDQLKNRHASRSSNTISGDLKLVLARYLHLYGDLNYHRNEYSDARLDYSQNNNDFPINFHRRMRSKELHMIDHPLVGILVQITPVKDKAKEAPAKVTNDEVNKIQTQ